LRKVLARGSENGKEEIKSLLPEVFPYSFIVLTLIGLFRTPWTPGRAVWEGYVLLLVVATLTGYAVTVIETRYLLALVPLLLCCASNGIIECADWLRDTLANAGIARSARSLRVVICLWLVLVLAPSAIAFVRRDPWRDLPIEQKLAGLWIRQQPVRCPLVMASGPWAAYYAHGRHIYLPDEDYATVLGYARARRVDYVIVAARCLSNIPCTKDTPLAFLLEDAKPVPNDLVLVHRIAERPEFELRIFRLRDRTALAASTR
jgi:hypothetical protein